MSYPNPDELKARLAEARAGHHCAICPAPIKGGFLMCAKHWHLVPRVEQQDVYRTWGRMQRSHPRSGFGACCRSEYFKARDRAIASAKALITIDTGEDQ